MARTVPTWPPLSLAAQKKARAGLTGKGRRKAGLFLIEGFRLLESAREYGWPIEFIIVREDGASSARLAALLQKSPAPAVSVYTAAPKVFHVLVGTVEPSGVLAVARQQRPTLNPDAPAGIRLLIADTIRDPGNLGALVRSAAAFAVDGVYLTSGCVELFNPKVVRATMGAVFSLPIIEGSDPSRLGAELRDKGYALFVADPHDGVDLARISPPTRWALVIGGETQGYAAIWREFGARPVRIPTSGKVESLNSAVAAGIILHHLSGSSPSGGAG